MRASGSRRAVLVSSTLRRKRAVASTTMNRLSSLAELATPSRIANFLRWLPVKLGYRHGPRMMSWLRKRWVLFRHPQADIRFGRNVHVGSRFSLFIPGEGSFVVGDGVEFRRDFRAEVYGDGRVTI